MSKYTDRIGERIQKRQFTRTVQGLVKYGCIVLLIVLAFLLYRWLTA